MNICYVCSHAYPYPCVQQGVDFLQHRVHFGFVASEKRGGMELSLVEAGAINIHAGTEYNAIIGAVNYRQDNVHIPGRISEPIFSKACLKGGTTNENGGFGNISRYFRKFIPRPSHLPHC